MNVQDTVTTLIRNYPGLYYNRADVLKHVFTSPRWLWGALSGQLIASNESELNAPEIPTVQPAAHIADSPATVIRRMTNTLMEQFRRQNAALLAQDDESRPTHSCLYLPADYNRFSDMPDHATDDWRAAARETLQNLYYMTADAEKGSHEYAAHRALTANMVRFKLLTNTELLKQKETLEAELERVTEALNGYAV